MKQYVIYDNLEMGMSADKFFVGLAAMVGDRFKFEPAISVEVSDEELATMIERILAAAGVKYYEIPLMRMVAFGPEAGNIAVHVEASVPRGINAVKAVVEQSIDSQVRCRRGGKNRKHWVQDAGGKEIIVIDARDEPPGETSGNTCQICGKPLTSKRAKLCGSKECKKQANANYQREYYRKTHAAAMEQSVAEETPAAAEESPSEGDLREVEEFEQMLAEEMAAEGLPVDGKVHISQIDGLPEPGLDEPRYGEEPALPVEEADCSSWAWLVEDGPRKGSRMTNKQIVRLLMHGNLRVGQHIRHERLGQCEVVKGKPPAQKLKQLYGNGSPRYILAAEISVGI